MTADRALPWDWYPGVIPENVVVDDEAYVETTFSFDRYRSRAPVGVRIGRGTCTYKGTMFDLGPAGEVTLGECVLSNGVRFICDERIDVEDYAVMSWNVVLMDNYRLPRDPLERATEIERVASRADRRFEPRTEPAAIRIGRNAWLGFDVCVLPGVTVGEGAIVGARSVVFEDVSPYTIVAGNPARVIRTIEGGGNLA